MKFLLNRKSVLVAMPFYSDFSTVKTEITKIIAFYAIFFPFLNNFLSGWYRSLYLIAGSV